MIDIRYRPEDIEQPVYNDDVDHGRFSTSGQGRPFTMMMPPPNVTGSLHMGHALNSTIQDILARYYRLRGRDVLWQPGTDHAGIATQMVVEKQLEAKGESRLTLGRDAFIKQIWQWRDQSGGKILSQLRRLGASVDWSRERFTLDAGLSRAVVAVFNRLYEDKLIYRANRLVNWDPRLCTAISDLEVEYRDVEGHLWHIRYPIDGTDQYITVATTRPETMAGDSAVAVHPDDERYQHLIGQQCRLPIFDRLIPIIADAHADPDKGSGAVKITPAHDFNDFAVGKRHDLKMIDIFDDSGHINDSLGAPWSGLSRDLARQKILQQLEDLGLLAQTEDLIISTPFGDRSGALVEPRLTRQWFVDAPSLAKDAIKAVKKDAIQFYPDNWKNTYFNWLENIEPWCISRQIWWGHRIPVWYGPDGTTFVAMDAEQARAKAADHYGKMVDLRQDEDVLDTWFSSALWPFSTLGWPDHSDDLKRYYPTDILVTGFDIIFFWVARMVMMGLYVMGDVPFRKVYVHALVRDSKGQKMSKSRGNVVDPLKMIDSYGSDALRFTLAAMAAPGRDVRLVEERLRGYRNFATKVWNAARFCQMHDVAALDGWEADQCQLSINVWILWGLRQAADNTAKALEDGRFDEAAGYVYHFAWSTFCDWYLELSKTVLADDSGACFSDAQRVETKAVMAVVLDSVLSLLSPFMPFITAHLRQALGFDGSPRWPVLRLGQGQKIGATVGQVIDCISAVRSIRASCAIAPKVKLSMSVFATQDSSDNLRHHRDFLQRMLGLGSISFIDSTGPSAAQAATAIQVPVGDIVLLLEIGGIVDLAAERHRLGVEIAGQVKERDRCAKKLDNPDFCTRAPQAVRVEQQRRHQAAIQKIAQMRAMLENLPAG